jgi:hypothetical protein
MIHPENVNRGKIGDMFPMLKAGIVVIAIARSHALIPSIV